PVLGNLFKSKAYQKQETELIFIMTAQLVKPVSPDDIPNMRGIDGLRNTSPLLGLEPKGEGIKGDHGYSTAPASSDAAKTAPGSPSNGASAPAKADAPASSNSAAPVSQVNAPVNVRPRPVPPVSEMSVATLTPESLKNLLAVRPAARLVVVADGQ
ncbi:MAG TPA: hypothetical protein VGV38_00380, partial [Pyrinomonadaceae bacterium]|nr:hypothetical protein [Pyrinomonadaceae bacterium]